MLSLDHGVYIIEKGYKKTVCLDGKYFHQNKLFFIITLIIFSEHSYFLRKSQITPERKQRKKYFLTPFALHRNIQTARKAFIYRLFRNLVRYSNSGADRIIQASFSTHLCRFVFIFSKFYLIFFSYQIIRVKIEPVQTIFSALIFPISITHPVE